MFKLTTSNQAWKASAFSHISFGFALKKRGQRQMSNRGVDRYVKAKKKIDYQRKQREKQEREIQEALPKLKYPVESLTPLYIDPDAPLNSYAYISNSRSFLNSQIMRESVQENLRRLDTDYPLGLNDISSFLGYRSGVQMQHYNNILNSLIHDELNTNVRQNRMISFIKLASTLKLNNLFNKEHFTFFMQKRMSAALDALLKLQDTSSHNLFTPVQVIQLLKYVVANPDASFLLENIKYCSTIKQSLRPITDAVKIEKKLIYQIFDPVILQKIEVLPLAHAMMFIFPETFLSTIDLEGLFLNQILTLRISNKTTEDIEYHKYNSTLQPSVYDVDQFNLKAAEKHIKDKQIHPFDFQKVDRIYSLHDVDCASLLFPLKPDLVKWGQNKTPQQIQIQSKIAQNKYTPEQIQYLQNQNQNKVTQIEINNDYSPTEQPFFGKNQLNINSLRFSQLNQTFKKWFKEQKPKLLLLPRQESNQRINTWISQHFKKELELKNKVDQDNRQKYIQQLKKQVILKEQQKFKKTQQVSELIKNNPQQMVKRKMQENRKIRVNSKDQNSIQNIIQYYNQIGGTQQTQKSSKTAQNVYQIALERVIRSEAQAALQKYYDIPQNQVALRKQAKLLQQVYNQQKNTNKSQQNKNKAHKQGSNKNNNKHQQLAISSQQLYQQQVSQGQQLDPQLQQRKHYENLVFINKVNQQIKIVQKQIEQGVFKQLEEQKSLEQLYESDSLLEEESDNVNLDQKRHVNNAGYFSNQILKETLRKYTQQSPEILNLFAQVFFNSPNVDHGIKSLTLAYLILNRLTYYVDRSVSTSKIQINDLLALAQHEDYEAFFTDRFANILQSYEFRKQKLGNIYNNLLEKFDGAECVHFKPVIVTKMDQDFYDQGKVISYGKFQQTVEYESKPESFLTLGQAFETQDNLISCRNSHNDTRDISDCLVNNKLIPGYSHETMDLMNSVLSNNSSGMYKILKRQINNYSELKYQLSDRLQEFKDVNFAQQQRYLLGLNEISKLLYTQSKPLQTEEIIIAFDEKQIKEGAYLDGLNAANLQSQDFISPTYQGLGQKIISMVVNPYNKQHDQMNRKLIEQQQRQKGIYIKQNQSYDRSIEEYLQKKYNITSSLKLTKEELQSIQKVASEQRLKLEKENDVSIPKQCIEKYNKLLAQAQKKQKDHLAKYQQFQTQIKKIKEDVGYKSEIDSEDQIQINQQTQNYFQKDNKYQKQEQTEQKRPQRNQNRKQYNKKFDNKQSQNVAKPQKKNETVSQTGQKKQYFKKKTNNKYQTNYEEREQQGSRYSQNDDDILKIIGKKQKKNVEQQILKVDQNDNVNKAPLEKQGQQKHEKRAAHQARKHFKRKDTQPPKNKFSTMKPRFMFSLYKRQSSLARQINNSLNLQDACNQVKNIFKRNNNTQTLKELIEIPSLSYFKSGTQCLLAIFFYEQGYPLPQSSNLICTFQSSMGQIQVDYNKYLKSNVFDFELGDQAYIKTLEHLKQNFNRGLFKKVLAHIIRYSNTISFQLATQLNSFVSNMNIPLTHLQFVNLIYKNDIMVSLSTLVTLLNPISNYTETNKDVYSLYRSFVKKYGWNNSIQPLQNYINKLVKAGDEQYITYMVEDMRSIILSKKMKSIDKSASSEQSKRLQQQFKQQLKKQELEYVIDAAGVLGFAGAFEKAQSLFDQFREQKSQLTKQNLKVGFNCYTRNPIKLQEIFDIVKANKQFLTIDTFARILQPIKRNPRNKLLLDRVLQTFLYSGIIQKQLTSVEVNSVVEAFTRTKNTNSYPRLLEYLLKYELKIDDNSQKIFYNVIKDSHTTLDSKQVIVNLLDTIFNKDRENERQQYRLNRQRQDQKKKKLIELRESELKKVKENLEELEKLGVAIKKTQQISQVTNKNNKSSKQTSTSQTSVTPTVQATDKQQPKQKKSKKSSKNDDKLSKANKKQDNKAKRSLSEISNKRTEIIPQAIRLSLTRNQMRRGGRQKFLYFAVTEQQMQDDLAVKQAQSKKRRA